MKTIAIVGAGPGLGLSIAKKFGAQQFNVVLIARNTGKLSAMVEELSALNIQAKYYVADIRKSSQLQQALCAAKQDVGGIDVLEFSPNAGPESFIHTLDITPENVMEPINGFLLPAIQCVNEVLPEMQEKGEGAILFTTGISAFYPIPAIGNAGIAKSGLRNYLTNLHNILKGQGVYVGHLSVGAFIAPGTEGDPDLIAEAWYDLYRKKAPFEATFPRDMNF